MSIGGSIEDHIATKLHLAELSPEEQVKALLQYLRYILDGVVKTSPPELKGLLNLMFDKLVLDTTAVMTKFIINNETSLQIFFKENFQRFDRFEFQPFFDKFKGLSAAKAYTVPVNERRNFEQMRPLNTKAYQSLLENNSTALEDVKRTTQKTDYYQVVAEEQATKQKLLELFEKLQKKTAEQIAQGVLVREQILKYIKDAEQECISALQLKYNEASLNALTERILEGKIDGELHVLFEQLGMPLKTVNKLYNVIESKLSVKLKKG